MSTQESARTRRTATVVVVLLLVLGIAFGVTFGVVTALRRIGDTGESGSRTLAVTEKRLTVDVGRGGVIVTTEDIDEVRVKRTVHKGWRAPRITERSDGDGVHIEADCPMFSFGGCRVDYELVVPTDIHADVEVSSGQARVAGVMGGTRVTSSSGDVTATGLGGTVELGTSSGDLTASGISGADLRLEASSGDIDATNISSSTVGAEASSGNVTLAFSQVPDAVDVEASSGDVDVRPPAGDTAYDVEVETSSGDSEIDVPTDPDAPNKITIDVSSGDVAVTRG